MSSEESSATAGRAFGELVDTMRILRSPGGCPWDAQQTHQSLIQYLIEECYEVIEAIDTNNREDLREELGDLLLQIVFHAQIATDTREGFTIVDVVDDIRSKLHRRHPWVFVPDYQPVDVHDTEAQWFAQKKQEKQRDSATDGIPMGMPGLLTMAKLYRRAQHDGIAVEIDTADIETLLSGDNSVPSQDAFINLVTRLGVYAAEQGWDPEDMARQAARQVRDVILEAEASQMPDDRHGSS